jgi:membrane protease YdiL (CAAX protease family)
VTVAAAPRRAAALTVAILLTGAIRGLLLPVGELPAAVGFVIAIAGSLVVARWAPSSFMSYPLPVPSPWGTGRLGPAAREAAFPFGLGAVAGVATGLVLLLPVIGAGASGRPLSGFWGWGAAIVLIATLEEVVIRGRLQPAWTAEGGPVAGLVLSAAVFALIHLPRYGLGAMPLDFAVGLALGGLRAVTGRVAPCAIAHVIADWGAWFWL